MSTLWTLGLGAVDLPPRELIGGKAWSLARMCSMGLSVPPAFVITTNACRHFLKHGEVPAELEDELSGHIAVLETQTGRRFGGGPHPLLVSVRSGAAVSMPGMMDTVLNLGINDEAEAQLAAQCGDARFARDTHRRFLELYAAIVLRASPLSLAAGDPPSVWREHIARAAGAEVPIAARAQLRAAVRAVFESWNSRRAKRYRSHHGIADDLSTAVTVQAMVFGNLDSQSGTGVLFTRNPLSGANQPYGEYLPCAQGEDVVSGKCTPQPLARMHETAPEALEALLAAAKKLETANGDMQDIEFTVERGRLFLLQSRAGKRAPEAALRIAVDMVRDGLIAASTALTRVSPEQFATLTNPKLRDADNGGLAPLATGESACPGVGIGRVVTDSDEAERRASAGEAVILARPTTSPEDLHGMIAAKAIVTELGGSTSHAAVVSRSLGRPCVVGCGEGKLTALAGRIVTVDGQSGRVHEGALEVITPDMESDPYIREFAAWSRAAKQQEQA